jgi:hypothetical protein
LSSDCDVLTQDIDITAFSTPKSLKRALGKHFSESGIMIKAVTYNMGDIKKNVV